MSSWKNAAKSQARSHRERSQPAGRAHLGFLEKKKDYKLRAEDYQKKRDTLKGLKRKALDRNPDEYYFNMVHTEKMDGVHQRKESDEPEHMDAQLKLMYSQDQRYVNMKRASELKKIEKLKSSLHLIDSDDKPKNKHIIFVDTKKEAAEFDPAAYFDTHPALVDRAYNRPRRKTLEQGHVVGLQDEEELQELAKQREKQYKQLTKRIEREKELNIISQKMEMKKHLLDKKAKRKKIQDETKSAPAQYRWCYQRKR